MMLLPVAAILCLTVLMRDRSFRISRPSDVNDQIRDFHRKMIFDDGFRFRHNFDLFVDHRFQRIMPRHPSMLSARLPP
jgi:hypothetical protein